MATRQREKAQQRKQLRQEQGPSARLRQLRMSPRKVRLVVDLIRGKPVELAMQRLAFCRRAAAEPVAKLLRSAIANAEQRELDVHQLVVEQAFVDEGPTSRRWLPRAMGRATRIRRRSSHITLVLNPPA
jgi:large subunit ribosomal protein L22